jgi:hypothetical protein
MRGLRSIAAFGLLGRNCWRNWSLNPLAGGLHLVLRGGAMQRPDAQGYDMEKLFPKNEATVERVIRVVAGLGALSLVFVGPHSLLGLIGIVPLATGLIGSCPLYTAFGFSTNGSPRKAA